MDAQDLFSHDARLLVLETSVAALIAQLPPRSLGEVATMLCFVAGLTEEADEITPSAGARQLGYVRHWASEMLGCVMVSRPDALSPERLSI